jgi:glycosyltransferase involved in cell wall biosynthesis
MLTNTGPRIPLVYALHSGNLYGTERMALYTAAGLGNHFAPVILAPSGPAIEEARARGFEAIPCDGTRRFSDAVRRLLASHRKLAFLATGVVHSLICLGWNQLYRRRISHLHLVHGGASEKLSYGRKKLLNRFPVQFVGVSAFVRDKLIAHGVDAARIEVIENFLPEQQLSRPRRHPFADEPRERLIVISRLDPEKRVSLLLEAFEQSPDLRQVTVHVYGSGRDAQILRERAARTTPNIQFDGFLPDLHPALTSSDLLVHLCPEEPFGLAIIEAMAAGVPVLVPDSGGAGSLVDDNTTGFRFHANDPLSLAACIRRILACSSSCLNQIVECARQLHQTRFSAAQRILQYDRLLMAGFS